LAIAKRELVENWKELFIKSGVYWAMLQGLQVRPVDLQPRHLLKHTPLYQREREKSVEDKLKAYLQAHPEENVLKETNDIDADE